MRSDTGAVDWSEAEFWQREAARYDAASRLLMTRVRTEISIGGALLTSLTGALIAARVQLPEALFIVPFLVLGAWSLVIWSVQESYLADAHLMLAERRIAQCLGRPFGSGTTAWADGGGRVAHYSSVGLIAWVSWGLITLAVCGASLWAICTSADVKDFWWVAALTTAGSLSTIAFAGHRCFRNGDTLFASFEKRGALGDWKKRPGLQHE